MRGTEVKENAWEIELLIYKIVAELDEGIVSSQYCVEHMARNVIDTHRERR